MVPGSGNFPAYQSAGLGDKLTVKMKPCPIDGRDGGPADDIIDASPCHAWQTGVSVQSGLPGYGAGQQATSKSGLGSVKVRHSLSNGTCPTKAEPTGQLVIITEGDRQNGILLKPNAGTKCSS